VLTDWNYLSLFYSDPNKSDYLSPSFCTQNFPARLTPRITSFLRKFPSSLAPTRHPGPRLPPERVTSAACALAACMLSNECVPGPGLIAAPWHAFFHVSFHGSPIPHCRSGLRHFHRDYYKSSPLWFVVGGTKALIRSSKMNTVAYVVRAARA
jgi:hypothetical protein